MKRTWRSGRRRSRGCFPDQLDEVDRSAIKGTWKNGQIILDAQADWPDGCRLTIVPEPLPEIAFMTEDEQGDDPELIRRWLAAFDAIPPLSMPPEEEAEWQAWRQKAKEYNVEAVRRQMAEGLP